MFWDHCNCKPILFLTLVTISICFILQAQVFLIQGAKIPKRNVNYIQNPYVTFYSDEHHRGTYYHHYLKKECTNLPSKYDDWASSVNSYERCVIVCEHKDCQGNCGRVHDPEAVGVSRLSSIGLNDKVSSIKFCYTFLERGR